MKNSFIALVATLILSASFALASDDHDHDHDHDKETSQKVKNKVELKKDDHEHSENEEGHAHDEDSHAEAEGEHSHNDSEDHGHDEESTIVGPNKGVLEASKGEGIKLSPQAEKNFEISKVKYNGKSIELSHSSIVTAGTEVNVYRFRNGFYKRIDFETVKKLDKKIELKSKDLKSGDEIAVTGLGFLRLAEIAAFGGAPEGHSH